MTTPTYINLLPGGAAADLTKMHVWSTELKKGAATVDPDSKLLSTPSSSSASAFSATNCSPQTGSCDFGKSLVNNTSSYGATTRDSDQVETGQKIKRPMNAFMVWSQERRAQIANSESKMHNSQISKELGAEWRKMSAEKKAPYIRRAKELRDELLRQHPDYVYRPKRKPRPQPKTVNSHSMSPSSASAAAAVVKQHIQRSAADAQIPTATAAQFLLATEAQKQQSMMLACQLQTQLFASFLKESQQKKDLLSAAVKQCPAAAAAAAATLPASLTSTGTANDVGFMPYVGNAQTPGQYLPADLNLLSTLSSMNTQLHPALLLNKFAQSQLPQLQSFADVNSQ